MKHNSFLFVILLLVILVLATFLRVREPTLRPLHNDEGVNFHFLEETARKGYYPYSHENYHGPSYFYLTRLFVDIFGEEELGLRSSAIFAGLGCMALLVMLAGMEGWLFVIFAAVLVGLSSSLVFYSRYAIHESLFVFAAGLAGFSIVRWWQSENSKWILSGFCGLALLITTKETFIITLFCLFFAALALGDYGRVWRLLRQHWQSFGIGSVLCAFLVVFTFSGGFRWAGGLREMLLAVPQWVSRNESDHGHHKPFAYYADMLMQTEPYLLCIFVVLLFLLLFRGKEIAFLLKREAAFGRFLAVWTLLAFLVYSFVKYKTPWLIINITYPAALLLAWLLVKFVQTPRVGQAAIVASLSIFAWSAWSSWEYNFIKTYGPRNPFSYVHSSPGMVEFLEDMQRYWERSPDAKLLVAVRQYWPLPYYTRKRASQVHYVVSDHPERYTDKYDVIAVNYTVKKDIPGWQRKYYRFSDVQESEVYFRKGD